MFLHIESLCCMNTRLKRHVPTENSYIACELGNQNKPNIKNFR